MVGAGAQARINLKALAESFGIQQVRILTRSAASAERFAEEINSIGMESIIAGSPKEVLSGADIIVSTVPRSRETKPFLDPADVPGGAFVSAVDLAINWMEPFETFDRIITDDIPQARSFGQGGKIPYRGDYDADCGLILEADIKRSSATERVLAIHPGTVVGVWRHARTHSDFQCSPTACGQS